MFCARLAITTQLQQLQIHRAVSTNCAVGTDCAVGTLLAVDTIDPKIESAALVIAIDQPNNGSCHYKFLAIKGLWQLMPKALIGSLQSPATAP